MCETCRGMGLERVCKKCGGFDWVTDVYVYEDDPLAFALRLCVVCLSAWYELEQHA